MSYDPSEPRDSRGRWTAAGGALPPRKPVAGTLMPWAKYNSDLSRYGMAMRQADSVANDDQPSRESGQPN